MNAFEKAIFDRLERHTQGSAATHPVHVAVPELLAVIQEASDSGKLSARKLASIILRLQRIAANSNNELLRTDILSFVQRLSAK